MAPLRTAALTFAFSSISLIGCGAASAPAAAPESSPVQASAPAVAVPAPTYEGDVARFAADPRIGVYVSIPWGFSTSSYWIEGPTGLVLIDTQFLPSAADELVVAAEAMTGKKVVLAVVLHANPDKFNGTATLQARGIRVVTSAEVAALIPAIHEKRRKVFQERYAPDYPEALPKPESFGDATRTLEAGGLTLTVHAIGAGCSESHVVIEWEGHVFPGDLVASGTHSWLEIGKTDEWLKRLGEIKAMKPRFVHPGRGPSAGPELLDEEDAYLRKVMAIVAAEKPVLPPPDGALERVKERLRAAFPGLGFPVFLNIGVPAEWARQARQADEKR